MTYVPSDGISFLIQWIIKALLLKIDSSMQYIIQVYFLSMSSLVVKTDTILFIVDASRSLLHMEEGRSSIDRAINFINGWSMSSIII